MKVRNAPQTCNFWRVITTLQDRSFSTIWLLSREESWSDLRKILSRIYHRTRKSPLNFGSRPDLESVFGGTVYVWLTDDVRPSMLKMTMTSSLVLAGRCVRRWLSRLIRARQTFPQVGHVCSEPVVDALPARALHASRLVSASFSCLSSASHAPFVIPARRAGTV